MITCITLHRATVLPVSSIEHKVFNSEAIIQLNCSAETFTWFDLDMQHYVDETFDVQLA